MSGPGVIGLGVFVACSSGSKSYDDDDTSGGDGTGAHAGSGASKAGRGGSSTAGRGNSGGSGGSTAGSGGSSDAAGGSDNAGTSGDAGQSNGGDNGASGAGAGETNAGGDASSTGGSSARGTGGTSGGASGSGTGGTSGGASGKGGTGGTSSGSGGSAGGGGSACSTISIEPVSHHLGDGDYSQGTSFSRSFTVSCTCPNPYLSFQIDGPNRETPPLISLNGQQLSALSSFYPAVSSADVWQSNGGSSYDYNGYLQIHYSVSGKLTQGQNTFSIANGSPADDYNFQDVRIDCNGPVDPIGPDVIDDIGWVGYYADRSGDDPLGIQGAFYGYGDGTSCTVPKNLCSTGECCMNGATVATDPSTNWGCGMGLALHNTGGSTPVNLAYTGSADCFDIELSGSSGGNEVRMQAAPYDDMTGKTAPVFSLGVISGTTVKTVCFSDFACPSDAPSPCTLSGSWYRLEMNVVGGQRAGTFGLCMRSLIPYAK